MRAIESPDLAGPLAQTALVLIPGTVNYFYNTTGRRVAEALTELGLKVSVRPLAEVREDDREPPADICLLMNIGEVFHGFGDRESGARHFRKLGPFRFSATVTLDSVQTNWFHEIVRWCDHSGVETILDLGLIDQSIWLTPGKGARYHFVPDGLTGSELKTMREAESQAEQNERPIPWAFVGHVTADRAGFVDFLVREVDPSGFVYVPPLEPYTESGSPHLNHDQFLSVLSHSRYHIWCSHHENFYMEPERFRLSMLSGCVPIKVLIDGQPIPDSAPLRPFMLRRSELSEALRPGRDRWFRRLLFDSYGKRSLASSFEYALAASGIRVPGAEPQATTDRLRSLSA